MVGASRQRTFDLVPETLIPQHAPKKAMTLKQAKKAAAMATKGPRMSRAERARLEKEELDRQRKERDRLRASEKAKLAREKKASKLAEEKASRKKMGIPEPSKFVRSSQPTISAFVTAGSKRRRTDTEGFANDSYTTFLDNEEPTGEAQVNVSSEFRIHEDLQDHQTTFVSPEVVGQAVEEQASKSIPNQAPQLYETGISSSMTSPLPIPRVEEKPRAARKDNSISPTMTTTKNNLRVMCDKASEDCEEFDDDAELFAAMAESDELFGVDARGPSTGISKELPQTTARKLFGEQMNPNTNNVLGSENLHNSTSKKTMPPPPLPAKRVSKTRDLAAEAPGPIETPNFTRSNTLHRGGPSINTRLPPSFPTQNKRQPLVDRQINMPPPPLPSKRPSHSASPVFKPLTRKNGFAASLPPSSTQAFLSDNFDAFFPSPSQETRELGLEETAKYPVGQVDQIHDRQEFLPNRPSFDGKLRGPSTEYIPLDNFIDLFPSASQETREMREDANEVAQRIRVRSSGTSAKNPDPDVGDRNFRKSDTSNLDRLTITVKTPSNFSDVTTNKPKARYFTEKEEDIIHTAPNQGRTAIASEKKQSSQKREFARIASQNSDYDYGELDWNSKEARLVLDVGEEL